jgi:lipopolysaccharide biosynthesis glycosyltransferase
MKVLNMIALFADAAFIMPAFCTTMTVLKFAPENTGVTVFCVDFNDREFQKANDAFSKLGPTVELRQVDSAKDFEDCVWRTALGMATWGRLFLDKLLPRDLSRVLYLDCDTLVQSDLTPLLNAELGQCSVGACKDQFQYMASTVEQRRTELRLSPEGDYFNAGVLLFDWKAVTERNLFAQAREALRTHQGSLTLRFADQDILNLLLDGNWRELDPAWNLQSFAMAVTVSRQPRIAHFVGYQKPWSRHCSFQMLKFRRKYAELQNKAGPLAQDLNVIPLVVQLIKDNVRLALKNLVRCVTFKAAIESQRKKEFKNRLEMVFDAYDQKINSSRPLREK